MISRPRCAEVGSRLLGHTMFDLITKVSPRSSPKSPEDEIKRRPSQGQLQNVHHLNQILCWVVERHPNLKHSNTLKTRNPDSCVKPSSLRQVHGPSVKILGFAVQNQHQHADLEKNLRSRNTFDCTFHTVSDTFLVIPETPSAH